ncbi:ABC transporter ATP-binding protein [Thermosediminibacter litoriperuensis]|uniref:ABC-type quaternary amine transporter n=1 Tax=Thermosediminibacter litoriperuensis TaxID=291989 RepID=A0A5S5AGX7_9FIRM|nr:ABC transporter ATP-binding protein [Thermosediminibacter litoriperuensis]TYP49254.1 iron(III) transport system ATP-binding protein [Thermosediminibacter litoriperuensis]
MFLEVENISFQYPNSPDYVLKNFTLTVPKGITLAIWGESGSGKSTALRLISGLEIPQQGRIKISGKIMVDHNTFVPPEKRGIGMVFQDYALFPHMTVARNILFGLNKMPAEAKKVRLQEILALVDLKGFEHRYPYELSGGQQQRVALARAIAPKPHLLLLDEPFSNLDSSLKTKIRQELKTIIVQTGITTVFVTHDREDVKCIADIVVILQKGRIMEIGNPSELL